MWFKRGCMAHDDDSFRIRPGRVGNRGGTRPISAPRAVRARPKTFMGEVHAAIRRAGGNPYRLTGKRSGRFNARGRGASAALSLKGRNGWSRDASGIRSRTRRVAVKARVVKLNPQRSGSRGRQFVSAKAAGAHLRYLERDGVTRDGERGQVYCADRDMADGPAFLDRGREDRHQFRFIVSAEEGVELTDIRETTRDLMKQMEIDLATKLDWVAVDHHNTGHPHTHILVRGITDNGKILNIAGDYIAHGIRERASEIVTIELGHQTEQEISRQLEHEIDADRFTRLDKMLIAEQQRSDEFTDLRPDKDMTEMFRKNRALMIDHARKLERMGLATETQSGLWKISPRAEQTLREIGIRGDIIKTMHEALERNHIARDRDLSRMTLHGETAEQRVVGRVLSKGLGSDEMGDRIQLVIDGVDGRIHHIELDTARAEGIRRKHIIEIIPARIQPRAADRNIMGITDDQGIYQPSNHIKFAAERTRRLGGDPHAFVKSHVRRLEALRRAGHVERIDEDHWQVPKDLPERGLAYDQAREGADMRVNTLSDMSLKQQIDRDGSTWLDQELISPNHTPLEHTGFGREVADALERRKRTLVAMGLAHDIDNGSVRAPKDLIQQLDQGDFERAGKALAAERGRTWEPAIPGNYVMGQLVGTAQLTSGKFAMIDNGLGFSLVPWEKTLEQQLGKHISGVAMPGGGVDWSFGRSRGLGL